MLKIQVRTELSWHILNILINKYEIRLYLKLEISENRDSDHFYQLDFVVNIC